MKLKKLWSLQDISVVNNPESVYYDSKRECLYIINTTDGASKTGFVSKVALDGKVLDAGFTQGLLAARGSIMVGDSLFVNQLQTLTEIDCVTGAVVAEYFHPEAVLLNDPAVDQEGNVYASDINGDSIFRLSKGKFERWLVNKEGLTWPNGLRVEGDKLYLCPWGIGDANWVTAVPSNMKVIDLHTKEISDLGCAAQIGPLDGLEEFDENHFIVNNWWYGKVYLVHKTTGEAECILDTGLMSMGDIHYIQSKKMLLCPIGNAAGDQSHQIIAYQISE